jgi:hypothetical protein
VKNNKGFVSVVVFFLVIAITLAVAPIIMNTVSFYSVSEPERAFFIAEAGIQYYAKLLDEGAAGSDSVGYTVSRDFGGGTFTVVVNSVTPGPGAKEILGIVSTGRIALGSVNFDRVIQQSVILDISPFKSALYCEGDADIKNVNNATINQNLYVGGDLDIENNANTIIHGVVEDNLGSDVDIPEVDWAYWQAQALSDGADHVKAGDFTFNGNSYDGDYYVNGNAILDRNGMDFNGTIIATGDIIISSNNTVLGVEGNGHPSAIAGNDFNASNLNKVTIHGTVYAVNNIIIKVIAAEGSIINGTLMCGNMFDMGQANNITWNLDENASSAGFTGGDLGVIGFEGFKEI